MYSDSALSNVEFKFNVINCEFNDKHFKLNSIDFELNGI